MSRYEELEKTIKDAQAEIERLQAKEQEAARKAWVPGQRENVLVLHADGSITHQHFSGSDWRLEHRQGKTAPDTERGRTWLEAIAAWERALKESYDERANGEDGEWWYWHTRNATGALSCLDDYPFGRVFRRTKEEAEQDGERWGKRLAQGRGF